MTRRLLPLLAVAVMLACRESDPQPLELVVADPFLGLQHSIAGGGESDLVAYTRPDLEFTEVRLLRHDAARPDEVEILADLDVGRTGFVACLFVSGGFVVACSADGLQVFDAAAPSLPPVFVDLPRPVSLGITGRWLLAAQATTTLWLVSLDAPGEVRALTSPARVTSVLAVKDGFLVFTTTGYLHVSPDPTSPTITVTDHELLRDFRAAFADQDRARVAGPGRKSGQVSVAFLDVSDPRHPFASRVIDLDGEYGAFAWDGAGTSVVAFAMPTDLSSPPLAPRGYVLREYDDSASSVSIEGIPLPSTFQWPFPIAAHGDRLLMVYREGFGLFRMR